MSVVERIWYGAGMGAVARAALAPVSAAFEIAQSARGALYDHSILETFDPALPVLSVGNLTVGGTGKTPVSAWFAGRLRDHGARPGIVLRGYRGAEEADVHRRLNPDMPVIVNPDRLAGIRDAAGLGADVVVLDDAFQHRSVGRAADVVLVSAEQLTRSTRLLPAGPWREPISAARRADHIIITRKSASDADVESAVRRLGQAANTVPQSIVRLSPASLAAMDGAIEPLEALRGADVLAIAAIGEPLAFVAQLESLGARVTLRAFRDHHRFSDDEIRRLAADVPARGVAVCTLKDAVKLAGRWPASSRLWYVSQQLQVEHGASELDRLAQRVLDARAVPKTTSG